MPFCPWFALGLAASAGVTPYLHAADPVVQQPPVRVNAQVPLVKVGEYHMLERRHGPAAVAYGDGIFIIGGESATLAPSATIERFDVHTHRSTVFAHLRVARFWHGAALIGDEIYVVGGFVAVGTAQQGGSFTTDSVEIVNARTGAVRGGEPMPIALTRFGCVAVASKLYVVGGRSQPLGGRGWNRAILLFDPQQNAWGVGPALPTGLETTAAVVADRYIVMPGGYDSHVASDEMNVFDLQAQVWRQLPKLARKNSSGVAAALGHYLYLFGDYDHPRELLAYDLNHGTSEIFTLNYTPNRHGAAVVHDGLIYVAGGRVTKDSAPSDLLQVFAPAPWTTKPTTAAPK